MATIARLRTDQIQNGLIIDASDLNAEFDQLITEHNSKEARLDLIETGVITYTGIKSYANGIKTDTIDELGTGNGVTIDSTVLQDGSIQLDGIGSDFASVDTGTDEITTAVDHGLATEDAIKFRNAGGALPNPLNTTTVFFARNISTFVITVHPTAADAAANTNTVDLTTAGTGTNTIIKRPVNTPDGVVYYDPALDDIRGFINGTETSLTSQGFFDGYILIVDEKTAGTDGGGFTTGADRTRDLNQEKADTGNHATLASDQITLLAGTYITNINAPGFDVRLHQAWLQNITDASEELPGRSAFSNASSSAGGQGDSIIWGKFTITDTKTFEVQHRGSQTRGTDGFGLAANFVSVETYTVAQFWRLRD